MSAKRLGEILLAKKLITLQQLEAALSEQQGGRREFLLGRILMRKGLITEDDLMNALAEQCGIAYVSLKDQYIDWALSQKYIQVVGTERTFFPFKETPDSLWVALSNPLDVAAISRLEEHVRPKAVKIVLIKESELNDWIGQCEKRNREGLKDLLDKEE